MLTDVFMPKLADTLVEGTVASWLKVAGDVVQAGEPIAEIETDKVTTELTAPAAGTISELLVGAGETVAIGTPLVRIRTQDEQKLAPGDRPETGTGPAEFIDIPVTELAEEIGLASPAKTATPLAARVAQSHGIDLSKVNAPGQRITRADIEQHLAMENQSRQQPQPTVGKSERIEGKVKASASLTATALRLPPMSPVITQGDVFPLKGLRRATAARMAIVRQIPTGCAVVEADVTTIEEFQRQERDTWLTREGFQLTYTPFFVYALAQSLRFWPVARQALRNGQREERNDIHIGVAVALEDGLIVPVIRNADQLDLAGMARVQNDLVVRARTHRLQPEEVIGGIATLTNVGSMGGLFALPMLNENQAIILSVGAATRRTVGTSDGILYRSCSYLSMTFDRRLLDDLQAERFLLDVAHHIKQTSWREEPT
jgi:pyruvate/2-oxoglutarate dehydrogenase complex dihydrolipoamide acyltransferase (E2) component